MPLILSNLFFLKIKEGCKRINLVIRSLLPWLSILKTLLSQVDIVIMSRLLYNHANNVVFDTSNSAYEII